MNKRRPTEHGHPDRRDGDEDLALIAAIRAGDSRAFERLYRLHQPRLARFVGNIVRSPPIVEEVVNDTLMVAWEKPQSFAGNSRLSTWLFAIAYRKALRARQRRPLSDEQSCVPEPETAPDHALSHERTRSVLLDAIRDLSPEHRAVIDLTYFHEVGYREIAGIMDCPVDTVKTRMFHARRHLRRKLAGELSDWI